MSVVADVEAQLLVVPLPAVMRGFGYTHISVPFVTVRDDDGVEGTGFAYTLDAGAAIVVRMLDEVVAPPLLGRDDAEWGAVRRDIISQTRRLSATGFTAALSALDIAIWDLRATRAGVPLHELLGGSPRGIPIYGSGRSGRELTTDELIVRSTDYLAEGYGGVKLSVGALGVEADLARIRTVRAAIGDEAPLMIDGSEQLTFGDALRLGHAAADLGLVWFEEPLLAEDVDGYAALSRQLAVPIATGEHLQSSAAFERYADHTSVAVYQPDAALGGGITGMLAVAAVLEARHRPIAWHSLPDLHIHLAVSTDGTRWVEDFPILDGIIAEPLRPVAGTVRPPDRPGHGIVWDRDAIAHARVAG